VKDTWTSGVDEVRVCRWRFFLFFFGCVGRALDSPHACSNTLDVSYRAHTQLHHTYVQSITRGLKLWKRREREIADYYYNARL
jgi:hypothetical protein